MALITPAAARRRRTEGAPARRVPQGASASRERGLVIARKLAKFLAALQAVRGHAAEVAGRGLVPHDASAVVANVTVTGNTASTLGGGAHLIAGPQGEVEATEEEIIEHCRSLLARFKCPKAVVFADGLRARDRRHGDPRRR